MAYKKSLGKAGEEVAKTYLCAQGYCILETNFRCKTGEIDIIARDEDYIAFIEVKTRSSLVYGLPIESINKRKQYSIIKTAQTYLAKKYLRDINLRFDVVEVMVDNNKGNKIQEVRLIKNAF